MKITMEKLKSVLNKYGYSHAIDGSLLNMFKEMGIEIIEEKPDSLELARKLNFEEIEYRGRSYALLYDVGEMKCLYEKAIKELQEQVQKMKCCGNCGNLYNCSECNGISNWQLREE